MIRKETFIIRRYNPKIYILPAAAGILLVIIFRKVIFKAAAYVAEYGINYIAVQAVGNFVPVDMEAAAKAETVEKPEEEPETEAREDRNVSVIQTAAGIYGMDKLMDYDYVIKNFYVVPSSTNLSEEKLNLAEMAETDLKTEKNTAEPRILIMHTHGHETFTDSEENGKTITDAGAYLAELLREKYGYAVMHLTDSFDVVNGVLDRSMAYTYANNRIEEILELYPSIEVVIDLHRDGVSEDRHLITEINGKATAQIMLFNGISYTNAEGELAELPNPYITENLAMSYKLYLLGEMLYPDFIRCIYIEGYRYCLYHRAKSMLIEAGAQTNTYEEVYNAMEPLAEMLDREFTCG